jgi:polar amino acid transport system permease protein
MVSAQFSWNVFLERLFDPTPEFWRALGTTVYIAVIAQTVGVLLGLATVFAMRSRFGVVRAAAYVYVLVFRGTPIIVQIFFVYFGANLLLGFELFPRTAEVLGVSVAGAVIAGTVALAVNEGAYMSEIIRAGLASIDRGQMEAAQSVGMTRRLAMRRIVLPQAARVIIPPLGNQFNYMLKTTSLLAFIGVYEIFQDAQVTYSTNFKPVEIYAAVAVWYLLLTTAWSLVQVQLERRFGASDRPEDETWVQRILGAQAGGRV